MEITPRARLEWSTAHASMFNPASGRFTLFIPLFDHLKFPLLLFYQRVQEVTVIHRLAPFPFTSPLVAPSLSTGRSRRIIPSIPWFFIPLPMSSLPRPL